MAKSGNKNQKKSDSDTKYSSQNVLKIIQKDERAFNKFITENYNRFYKFAFYYIGNREDTEDILQEAFLKIFQKSHTYNFKSSFETWCLKIIRNQCIDFLRERKLKRLILPLTEFIKIKSPEEYYEPEKIYERKEIKEKIEQALNKLKIKEKEIFVLKHYNSLSIKEISKITGFSESNVKVILFRAVNKLKKILEDM